MRSATTCSPTSRAPIGRCGNEQLCSRPRPRCACSISPATNTTRRSSWRITSRTCGRATPPCRPCRAGGWRWPRSRCQRGLRRQHRCVRQLAPLLQPRACARAARSALVVRGVADVPRHEQRAAEPAVGTGGGAVALPGRQHDARGRASSRSARRMRRARLCSCALQAICSRRTGRCSRPSMR